MRVPAGGLYFRVINAAIATQDLACEKPVITHKFTKVSPPRLVFASCGSLL